MPDASTAPQDPLSPVRTWLEKDCSFTLSYQYMNLAINGLSQQTEQAFAADGSWSFSNQRRIWDHTTDYEQLESAEFYYRYEDLQLVCYSSVDGGAPQRAVLSRSD